MKWHGFILAVCVAALAGGAAGWELGSAQAYSTFGTTLRLLREGDLSSRWEQADKAYFGGQWEAAAWDLEGVRAVIQDYMRNHYSERRLLAYEAFLADARLAQVYGKLGRREQAEEYKDLALRWEGAARAGITNAKTLNSFVQKVDDKQKAKQNE